MVRQILEVTSFVVWVAEGWGGQRFEAKKLKGRRVVSLFTQMAPRGDGIVREDQVH